MFKRICVVASVLVLLSACSSNKSNDNDPITSVSNASTTTTIENTSNTPIRTRNTPIIEATKNKELGRNPNTFILNYDNNKIYYKSYVLINEENRYQGLFSKNIDGTDKKLLYSDFEGFLNVYNDFLYFTNTEGQLIELNLNSQKAEVIAGDDKFHIYGPLVIQDVLFYNNIDAEDNCDLMAYNIKEKNKTVVSEDVLWKFLSNYKNEVCFLDKNKNLTTWNYTTKNYTSHGHFDMEILQLLGDGSVIGYKDRSFMKSLDGKLTPLLKVENMFSSLIVEDDLFITTVDEHNYTQVLRYSLKTGKSEKIASPDFPLIGCCGKYLFCSSDSGMGDLQIVNTENGECKTFDDRFN